MKSRAAVFHVLLALFLLTAQVGMAMHGVSHVGDRGETHGGTGGKVCEQCVTYAKVGAGLGSDQPSLTLHESPSVFFQPVAFQRDSIPLHAFLSRAPPALH